MILPLDSARTFDPRRPRIDKFLAVPCPYVIVLVIAHHLFLADGTNAKYLIWNTTWFQALFFVLWSTATNLLKKVSDLLYQDSLKATAMLAPQPQPHKRATTTRRFMKVEGISGCACVRVYGLQGDNNCWVLAR